MAPQLQLPESLLAGAEPLQVADRIWWVGARLEGDPFQCHAYLIENGDQSVLIDPGSRLTWALTRAKIEKVLPFDQIRWFVLHHQDPDITGAMDWVEDLVRRDDACWITHWRAEVLLKHNAPRMPFWRIEDHDWKLDLGGRELEFVFTPYLHFPGAFATFDRTSGTLFSSDLFGGFSEGEELMVQGEKDFDGVKLFHEHYMPHREVLLHTMLRLEKLPIQMIAPQHGRLIAGPMVQFYLSRLKELDCGLYLLTRKDSDLERLMSLNSLMRDAFDTMVYERDFRAIASQILDRARKLIPVRGADFLAANGGTQALHLCSRDRFRGRFVPMPEFLRDLRSFPRSKWSNELAERLVDQDEQYGFQVGDELVLPLFESTSDQLFGLAILQVETGFEPTDELDEVLKQVSLPLAVAVERELLFRSLELERDEVYERSIRDPLTGLFTRRYLDDAASRMIQLHNRDPKAGFSVLMVDIDHFKQVNDTYGHLAGDQVLQAVAAKLKEQTRHADIDVRFGGEEFALFLPMTGLDEAEETAERLRQAVAAEAVETSEGTVTVTVSLGVAEHLPEEELAALIRRADTALYTAKEGGRDRVVRATD